MRHVDEIGLANPQQEQSGASTENTTTKEAGKEKQEGQKIFEKDFQVINYTQHQKLGGDRLSPTGDAIYSDQGMDAMNILRVVACKDDYVLLREDEIVGEYQPDDEKQKNNPLWLFKKDNWEKYLRDNNEIENKIKRMLAVESPDDREITVNKTCYKQLVNLTPINIDGREYKFGDEIEIPDQARLRVISTEGDEALVEWPPPGFKGKKGVGLLFLVSLQKLEQANDWTVNNEKTNADTISKVKKMLESPDWKDRELVAQHLGWIILVNPNPINIDGREYKFGNHIKIPDQARLRVISTEGDEALVEWSPPGFKGKKGEGVLFLVSLQKMKEDNKAVSDSLDAKKIENAKITNKVEEMLYKPNLLPHSINTGGMENFCVVNPNAVNINGKEYKLGDQVSLPLQTRLRVVSSKGEDALVEWLPPDFEGKTGERVLLMVNLSQLERVNIKYKENKKRRDREKKEKIKIAQEILREAEV
ncbi:MAG: hypothetical protein WCT40_02485 [Candidatus Magasanikbacteria bacterium]|jgi:hypothetical protein